MKKLLFFISIFLLPLFGFSQTAGQRRALPDIHPNGRVEHPRRSDNHHHLRDRHMHRGRGSQFNDRRRHQHNQRAHARTGRMI